MNKPSRKLVPVLNILLLLALVGCAVQGQYTRRGSAQAAFDPDLPSQLGTVFDSTVNRKKLKVRRVAVIPNRMPLFLTEADKWRKYNWQVLAGMFMDRGFDVVDYETSVEAFKRANLPMEDTGASEQKFARLAKILQADLLVMPYYGTSFQNKMIVVASQPTFIGLVTLQIYSAKNNKFIYRSDKTGKSSYFQGYAMLGMILGMIMPGIETVQDPFFKGGTTRDHNVEALCHYYAHRRFGCRPGWGPDPYPAAL